jgi:hypothetical protein
MSFMVKNQYVLVSMATNRKIEKQENNKILWSMKYEHSAWSQNAEHISWFYFVKFVAFYISHKIIMSFVKINTPKSGQ